MIWLEKFKDALDAFPEISDEDIFRAFPELQGDQKRLTYALLYWRHGIVVDEFKNPTWWSRIKKYIIDGFRRIIYRVRAT